MSKNTALEYFDYEIEIEFSRKTIREHRSEIDEIGRLLYDRLQRRSRYTRPMAYAIEGTDVAAATFPDGRTRTLTPAVPSSDPQIRAELTTPDILEYREVPLTLAHDLSGTCAILFDGAAVKIQALLDEESRTPVPPGVTVNPESSGRRILGEAVAASLHQSAAAARGDIEVYQTSVEDPLEMSNSPYLMEARIQRGRLTLSWVTQSRPGETVTDSPIFVGPPPDDHADLGNVVVNALMQ